MINFKLNHTLPALIASISHRKYAINNAIDFCHKYHSYIELFVIENLMKRKHFVYFVLHTIRFQIYLNIIQYYIHFITKKNKTVSLTFEPYIVSYNLDINT